MLTPTSIACPRCQAPLYACWRYKRNKFQFSYDKTQYYWCRRCSTDFTPEYIEACDRCTDLQCVQFSPSYMEIKPRRGTDDWKLIKTLFDKKDIRYNGTKGCYLVGNLPKYAHLKCVQTASWAFLHQLQLV